VEISTMGMSKMAKEKELESQHLQVVRKILQNIILIIHMDAERWKQQVVAVIGGNTRMVTRKDMEHWSGLMEVDTSGNSWMMIYTGMEYADGLMEMYIGESGKITRNKEREYSKRVEYFTDTNTKKATASAGVKYSDLIKSLSRNS
jgi:hypothetical protein